MEIFQDCGNRPIVFLRFNPDGYKENGIKYKSCFEPSNNGLKINEIEFNKRMDLIVQKIKEYSINIPLKEITIEYYYYSDITSVV